MAFPLTGGFITNQQHVPSVVGCFFEHLTAVALGASIEEEGEWDVSTDSGYKVEVKATHCRSFKLQQSQTDAYDHNEMLYVFWEWRYKKPKQIAKQFRWMGPLWRYISWNVLEGWVLPGRLVTQLLASKSIPHARLFVPPGRWGAYYSITTRTLKDMCTVPHPKWDGVNRWKTNTVDIKEDVGKNRVNTRLTFLANTDPFK